MGNREYFDNREELLIALTEEVPIVDETDDDPETDVDGIVLVTEEVDKDGDTTNELSFSAGKLKVLAESEDSRESPPDTMLEGVDKLTVDFRDSVEEGRSV